MEDIIRKADFELAKIKKGSINLEKDQFKYGLKEKYRCFYDQFPSLEEVNEGYELFCRRKTNKSEGFPVKREHLLKCSRYNFTFGFRSRITRQNQDDQRAENINSFSKADLKDLEQHDNNIFHFFK